MLAYSCLALAAILVILTWLERSEENAKRTDLEDVPLKPVLVKTVQAGHGSVTKWLVGEGNVEALRKQHLQFEEAGKVVYIATDTDGVLLREGSRIFGPKQGKEQMGPPDIGKVSKGQLLAKIDTRDKVSDIVQSRASLAETRKLIEVERASLSRAENELSEAEADYGRKKKLYEQKYLAKSVFDQARTAYLNARDDVASAKARMAAARAKAGSAAADLGKSSRGREKTEIYAPFDGLIARINIREGDYFQPENVNHSDSSTLLETAPITVIDTSRMEATLHLPEYEGSEVKIGQTAMLVPGAVDWFDAEKGREIPQLEGRVHSVSPQLDISRRTVRVKVRFSQQDAEILDGMFANCWIAVKEKKNVLRVPLDCLLFEDDAPYVFVIEDGTAQRRDLELGIIDEIYAEVAKGIEPEETVATKGRKRLTNGRSAEILGADKYGKGK